MIFRKEFFMDQKQKQKKEISISTATVHENRYSIFQPTDRPVEKTFVVQAKNGTIKITGKLGQPHKDILEFIKHNHIKYGYTKDGRLAFLIDLYQLRKLLGRKNLYNYETLNRLFEDLLKTTIEFNTESFKIKGSFLALVTESKVEVKHSKLGTVRKLTRIEFSKLGTEIIEKDIKLFYDPAPIIKLQHGVSKALVRYVLSHRNQPNGGWKLNALLETILGNVSSETIRNAKRFLKKDAIQLRKCGVIILNNRVFLSENSETPKPIEK
jgi:hypothetical protein